MERVILEEIAPNDRIMFGMKHLLVKYSLCHLILKAEKFRKLWLWLPSISEHVFIAHKIRGRNVWMEIVQKLVAMLLVSVVETEKALPFSLGITLTMAATSAMVQPYAQPQVSLVLFGELPWFYAWQFFNSKRPEDKNVWCKQGMTNQFEDSILSILSSENRQANRLHFYSFMCLALAAASFHYGLAPPACAALALPFLLAAAQALKPDNSESLALRLWEDKMVGLDHVLCIWYCVILYLYFFSSIMYFACILPIFFSECLADLPLIGCVPKAYMMR